jgi:hypothetical protein
MMINYEDLIRKYPWIVEPNKKCILSPDSDGLLCGLFMSHILHWKIVGFYDGKILLLGQNESVKDCIFLDMEIFRKDVKSLGHHMVLYNKRSIPTNWSNFDNCIQPNNIRGYDATTQFNLKYPLGAIHLLLGIVGYNKEIEIKNSAICPLLYTDGTFKNLFNYPDNCLSWLNFLCAEDINSPLNKIFFNDHYNISSLMLALKEFFEKLRGINDGSRGADKIKISNTSGEPINIENVGEYYSLTQNQVENTITFLKILDDLTGWNFSRERWLFDNFSIFKFKKESIVPSNQRFNQLISNNPLSWAMTSSLAIEYTLEEPDRLF